MDQQQLSERLRKSKQWVSQYLGLTELPARVVEKSRRLDFSVGQMTEIARLKDENQELNLVEECQQKGLSVKDLRARVNKILAPAGSKTEGKKAVQEETILDCHFLYDGKAVIVKPRAFRPGVDNFGDYTMNIQTALVQFVDGLSARTSATEQKEPEVAIQAA